MDNTRQQLGQKVGHQRGNRSQQRRRPTRPRDDFDNQLIQLDRVTRVTKGGKRFSFRALVVVGDKKGKVGIGMQKGVDVQTAIEKAVNVAKKDLIDLPLIDGTIPFEIRKKFKTAVVFMQPQATGKGIIAGSVVRNICELGGISNINVKIIGRTKNKANNARATIDAFKHITRVYELHRALRTVPETDAKKAKNTKKKESSKKPLAKAKKAPVKKTTTAKKKTAK